MQPVVTLYSGEGTAVNAKISLLDESPRVKMNNSSPFHH